MNPSFPFIAAKTPGRAPANAGIPQVSITPGDRIVR